MTRKKLIRAQEIGRRLNGFSAFGFGANWEYPASERDIVRTFITLLEDRRALYNPYNVEVEGDVRYSVEKIREHASEALKQLADGSKAEGPIRSIRTACRKYMDGRHDFPNIILGHRRGETGWLVALGELRAIVGVHVAALAAMYNIDVEEGLASILPEEAD